MIRAVCYSHIGKRLNHEDNFWLNGTIIEAELQNKMSKIQSVHYESSSMGEVNIYAVSDGMGGHNAGEAASRICSRRIGELSNKAQSCADISELVLLLQTNIARINEEICSKSYEHKEMQGMGATLVILAVCGSDCAILNIGDSRAYYFDGVTLTQITKDNTEGQRMLDLGILSRKELMNFPARKHLNRYMGYNEGGFVLQADVYYLHVKSGMVLLCSDGVTDSLTDYEIKNILLTERDINYAGKKIMERAVTMQNADNATVMLINIGR